ncbi:MAG: 6-hydroxycyclohex-1-ene-1-carbonyl-CoA dehydrogenase [Deltaproteobacteria bacterium]|nr:6-hydroxycyclohex-1-ene-1-carbonyl-CoA dehydrogenase [Deltaproteobacteria bacterium]
MTLTASAFFLDKAKEPLVQRDLALTANPGEVLLEVLACGVCHTDLGYADGSVAPKHALPLVLGHEIVGKVVEAGAGAESWMGKKVMVPAVMPCLECAFCKSGHQGMCPHQKMPGNDVHGGFSTHVVVPARTLVDLSGAPAGVDLRALSVVADAVSTAWQAMKKAQVTTGDAVLVVGAGGVGGFLSQLAKAEGTRVAAMDVDDRRLAALKEVCDVTTVNVKDRPLKDVRKEIQGIVKGWEVPSFRWKIFECSGTTPGQQLAYALMGPAATMVVVGFTPQPAEFKLANIMAFDATVHGTWGCPPARYAEVLPHIYAGRVKLDPFVTYVPLPDANKVLDDMAHHRLDKRAVLLPHP